MTETMDTRLPMQMLRQPNETTCGPSCLHAIYSYFGEDLSLDKVISEVRNLKEGGTLEVFLGCHALRRGYSALIYTYNLTVFDPTWFVPGGPDIRERLRAQMKAKKDPKLHTATKGYLEFLELGGEVRFEDLTIEDISRAVERLHNCKAFFIEDIAVIEKFVDTTAWEGIVHIFKIKKSIQIPDIYYAWSSPIEGNTKRRYYAVLHVPPIDSAVKTLRASIVQDRTTGKL